MSVDMIIFLLLSPTCTRSSTCAEVGYRMEVIPKLHPVSQLECDVIIGADGRRNTLPGKETDFMLSLLKGSNCPKTQELSLTWTKSELKVTHV